MWYSQGGTSTRVKVLRRVAAAASLLALVALSALAIASDSSSSRRRDSLSERNEFEQDPAWDAKWDLLDIQHHCKYADEHEKHVFICFFRAQLS
jgi:hypothetical protein